MSASTITVVDHGCGNPANIAAAAHHGSDVRATLRDRLSGKQKPEGVLN